MCEVKHCKQGDTELMYYGRPICRKHWEQHCDNKINLKQTLEIK